MLDAHSIEGKLQSDVFFFTSMWMEFHKQIEMLKGDSSSCTSILLISLSAIWDISS